jgi:hypothetical protein
MRHWLSLGLIVLVASFSGLASAAECEGVSMANSVNVGGARLVLNGMGIREATLLKIDVYIAGLYLPAKTTNGNKAASDDVAKRLTLKFVREVSKQDIVNAWKEGFDKTAGGNKQALKERIQKVNGWMANMKVGDELSFTYVPEKGLEVSVKGAVKGVVEGADFMKAFFLIWLGNSPPNPGLKSGLLGGKC